MFTRDIKNIVSLSKNTVLWNPNDWGSIINKYDKNDGVVDVGEVANSQKSATEIQKDIKILNEIINDTNGDVSDQDQAKEIKKTLEEGLKKINESGQMSRDTISNEAEQTRSVNAKNIRKEEASAFLAFLENANVSIDESFKVSAKDSASSFITGNREATVKYNLADVSIPNLLNHILNKVPYVSDGTFGPSEKPTVQAFVEFVQRNQNNPDLMKAITAVYTNSLTGNAIGGIVEEIPYLLENNDTNNTLLIEYLSTSQNTEGSVGGVLTDTDIKHALTEYQKGNKLFISLKNAIVLGGGSIQDITTLDAIKSKLTTDASYKFIIRAGLVRAAKVKDTATLSETSGQLKISEAQRKLLDILNTKEGQETLKKGIKDGFDKQIASLEDKMTPTQRADARVAVDAYMKELEKPSVMNLHIQSAGLAITNKGAGAGLSIGTPLDTWMADNVSIGVGLGTGKPAAGVGINFSKSITRDTSFLYGWAGAPFAGISSQFDTYSVTLIGSATGATLIASKKMNNRDSQTRTLDDIRSGDSTIQQIESYANDVNKKAKDIRFEGGKSTSTDQDNPTALTESGLKALNELISRDVQSRLQLSSFDTETNPIIRASMIRQAMQEVAQDRIDNINLDAVHGGVSLQSIGFILGVLGSIPFILPTISWERVNARINTKIFSGKNKIQAPKSIPQNEQKPTKKIVDQTSEAKDALYGRESLARSADAIRDMSRNPKYVSFNKALALISADKIEEAYSLLEKYSSKSKVVKDIVSAVQDDKSLLKQVLTYTYMSEYVDATTVTESQYKKARDTAGLLSAETRLAGYDLSTTESGFNGTHQPTSLGAVYPDQSMSVRIFATPKMRGLSSEKNKMYHRTDIFDGSLTVSNKINTDIAPNIKDVILSKHATRVEMQFVQTNQYLKSNNLPVLTRNEYNNFLKGEGLPKELTEKGVVMSKSPQIIQVRAMINGSTCLNGGDAIVYGTLKVNVPNIPPQTVTPPVSSEYTPGGVSASVHTFDQSATLAVGWVGDKEKQSVPTGSGDPEKIPTTSTPQNGLQTNSALDTPVPATGSANSGAVNVATDGGPRSGSR